jgi:hypothetical protein
LIYGGYGIGERNKAGERNLNFGMQMDMVVCNSCFKKEESKLIT